MPADDFVPARPPSLGAKQKVEFRVKTSGFGDGYVQRAADGINAATVSWELSWNALLTAEVAAIRSFFITRGGWQSFLYTVPGDIQRRYISTTPLELMQSRGLSDSFSVTLQEVHDP